MSRCLAWRLPAGQIPPAPTADDLVRDTVGLIQNEDLDHICQVQRSAYETHDTPIVVVTIGKVPSGEDIESLAMQWFNEWEIGKRKPNGQLVNQGILLLVAVVDRKARIELGADWMMVLLTAVHAAYVAWHQTSGVWSAVGTHRKRFFLADSQTATTAGCLSRRSTVMA